MKNPFTVNQWFAIFAGAWASITYVYANFPTIREFGYLADRLDAIERKIDTLGSSLQGSKDADNRDSN